MDYLHRTLFQVFRSFWPPLRFQIMFSNIIKPLPPTRQRFCCIESKFSELKMSRIKSIIQKLVCINGEARKVYEIGNDTILSNTI